MSKKLRKIIGSVVTALAVIMAVPAVTQITPTQVEAYAKTKLSNGTYENTLYTGNYDSPYASDRSKYTSAKVTIKNGKLIYKGTLYKITEIVDPNAYPEDDKKFKSTAVKGKKFTVAIPKKIRNQKEFSQLKSNLKKYQPGTDGNNVIVLEISKGSLKSITYDCRATDENGKEFGWYIKVSTKKSETSTLKYY